MNVSPQSSSLKRRFLWSITLMNQNQCSLSIRILIILSFKLIYQYQFSMLEMIATSNLDGMTELQLP